jgi:chemotaxis protein MotB
MTKFPILYAAVTALLLAGCVSQQKYDASQQKNSELQTEYDQLNQAMSAEVGAKNVQISRLQNAIKVSVNSELLFPSCCWEMPAQAKRPSPRWRRSLRRTRRRRSTCGYTDTRRSARGVKESHVQSHPLAKRADSVSQYMIAQESTRRSYVPRFGDADPVASTTRQPAGRRPPGGAHAGDSWSVTRARREHDFPVQLHSLNGVLRDVLGA